MKRLGILGGTFNPVHNGHLHMADVAKERLRLDEVWFVPCARPPHKTSEALASARHRLAMLRLALARRKAYRICDMEIRRGGTSYTVDTLRALRALYPRTRLFFIIGADSLLELHTWRNVEELLSQCTFVTVARPGYPIRERDILLPAQWTRKLRRYILRTPGVNVSSTDVRRRAAAGLPLRGLVPAPVERYIRSNGLYGAQKEPGTQNG